MLATATSIIKGFKAASVGNFDTRSIKIEIP